MRRGSALLIVLGMLSFMVVSAVSFSMYMRQTRLPSSYLRRNIAARYLVRASLARAIEELEGDFNEDPNWGKYDADEPDVEQRFYGIYDDPYPGCGPRQGSEESDVKMDGGFWYRRVFMPFGPTKYAECTVPTIPLEGLAYLPPALIDDVRKVSRFSRTATWRLLPYESGRYAYTVVNVSDLFDINRLMADAPRDSGLNRITLATLCSKTKGDPFDINTGTATSLQALLDKWSSSGYDTPFVSLADFNLLAGDGTDFAPFMKYVGKTTAAMLNASSSESANALFITDTWFPPETPSVGSGGSSLSGLDLSVPQPFLSWTAQGFSQVLNCRNTNQDVKELYEKNLGIGLVGLYDYLDSDSKPVSLALPTTEAVPMVTGVSCPAMLTPELNMDETREGQFMIENPNAEAEGEPKKLIIKRTCTQVKVASFGRRVNTKVLVSYPFKRMVKAQRRTDGHSFKLRGLLKVWAAPAGMGCRPADDDMNLSANDQNLWRNGATLLKNGVATFYCDMSQPSLDTLFKSDVMKTDDALDDQCVLTFACDNIAMPVCWKIKEEGADAKAQAAYPTKEYLSLDGLRDNQALFRPLKADGSLDGDWKSEAAKAKAALDENADQGDVTEFTFAGEYKLYAAVFLQVLDGSDVVDMVPATIDSDIEFLGASATARNANARLTGELSPLLNFESDRDVKFADIEGTLGAAGEVTYSAWKTLYAVDPRFNYAPENWFGLNANTTVSKDEWKQTVTPLLGQNGWDRDIFMFVSDQEYLQDIGELQFLPALQDFDGSGSFLSSYSPDFNGQAFSQRTGPRTGAFANADAFWSTYTAYNNFNGLSDDDRRWINPYRLYHQKVPDGVWVRSGGSGFKLNPYSDDARVLAAAFASTPFDYYVASTNSNQVQAGGRPNAIVENLTLASQLNSYSFGDSDVAQMDPNDMNNDSGTGIMDKFREYFQNRAAKGTVDWLSGWDGLSWQKDEATKINDDNDVFISGSSLGNASSCPLHQVDRKFLYSYWRECFDNRQQLFLIFVRAEPCTSASGSVALNFDGAQLGGRAVALVWRDPAEPEYQKQQRASRSGLNSRNACRDNRKKCPPHKTRVLFYHQFD